MLYDPKKYIMKTRLTSQVVTPTDEAEAVHRHPCPQGFLPGSRAAQFVPGDISL